MAAPAVASAQSGGTGGGIMYVATPKVTKVTCLRKCASKHRARGGSVLAIAGSELAGVNQLTYLGSYGSGGRISTGLDGVEWLPAAFVSWIGPVTAPSGTRA